MEFIRVLVKDLEEFKGSIFVKENSCLGSLESFILEFVNVFLFLVDLKVFDSRLGRLCLEEFTKVGLLNYLFKIVFYY